MAERGGEWAEGDAGGWCLGLAWVLASCQAFRSVTSLLAAIRPEGSDCLWLSCSRKLQLIRVAKSTRPIPPARKLPRFLGRGT